MIDSNRIDAYLQADPTMSSVDGVVQVQLPGTDPVRLAVGTSDAFVTLTARSALGSELIAGNNVVRDQLDDLGNALVLNRPGLHGWSISDGGDLTVNTRVHEDGLTTQSFLVAARDAAYLAIALAAQLPELAASLRELQDQEQLWAQAQAEIDQLTTDLRDRELSCASCGFPMAEGSRFCEQCGTATSAQPPGEPAASTPATSAPPPGQPATSAPPPGEPATSAPPPGASPADASATTRLPPPPPPPAAATAPAPPTTPPAGWVEVAAPVELVNTQAQVVGRLEPGSWFEAHEERDGWLLCVDGSGRSGWVSAARVRRR